MKPNACLAFAIAALAVVVSMAFLNLSDDLRIAIPAAALMAFILMSVMVRRGLLSLVVAAYAWAMLRTLPTVLDTSAWYFGRFALGAAVILALALYGLIVSLGDKPLFGVPLFDES